MARPIWKDSITPAARRGRVRRGHERRLREGARARGAGLPKAGEGYQKRELELALQLVESLAGDWKPDQYRDTYHDVLLEVIEKSVAPRPKKPARVVNLVKALEESLHAARPARKAARRRRAA